MSQMKEEDDKEKIESSRRSKENNNENAMLNKHHVLDIKRWKTQKTGLFNEMMLSTCPVMPSFHSKHGEPMEERGFNPENTNAENVSNVHITNRSSHLLTRMDTFKVDQQTEEIFVIDDYGMHVMYDCSLEDMSQLDSELLKIASYYVKRTEGSFNFSAFSYPFCDRLQVLEDLYDCEQRFQFAKSRLLMIYLDAFEHICDPLEQ